MAVLPSYRNQPIHLLCKNQLTGFYMRLTLALNGLNILQRKKCPYSGLFWSAFFPHFPAFGLNTPYLSAFRPNAGKCRKNGDQNNSEYGHFLHCVWRNLFREKNILSLLSEKVSNINIWKSPTYVPEANLTSVCFLRN